MSITRAQIATQLLNKMAPKGEKLAYINNREAELLKRMGGAGVDINKTGIKSYYYDEVGQTMGGTGFQDTSSLTGGSGNDGGGSYDYIPQPTVAKLNTINTSDRGGDTNPYGLRSKFQRGLDKALPYLAGFIGSKLGPYTGYKAYDSAKTNQEKRQEELNRFTNAINTGSFYVPGQTGLPEGLIAKSDSLLGFQNRAPEPTINTGGGDNQIIPRLPMIAQTPSDVESTSSDFDLYAALEGREAMRFGENPFGIMGAAQRFSEGGEVRQAYGLGKLVKKATKAVKKVVKSDLGKAALTAAAAYYAPALLGKSGYISGANPLFSATGKGGITDFLVKKGLGAKDYLRNLTGIGLAPGAKSTMSPTKRILTGLGFGATVAPFFMGGEEEDEETLDQAITRAYGKSDLDIPGIRRAALGYSDPNELYFKLPSAYRLNAAEGGIMKSFESVKNLENNKNTEIAKGPSRRRLLQIWNDSEIERELGPGKDYTTDELENILFKLHGGMIYMAEGGITSIDVDDLPMSKEGSPKYYNPEGEEISFKEFEEAMKKEKQIMPKKKPSRTKKAEGGIASEDKVKMLIKRGADNDLIKTYVEGISDSEIEQIRNMMRADKAEGGLMNLGGNEMDLRGGGFVPIGAKEKADDVPARLSKNEFVFTADAVRAAGGGSIENGAQKMYNTMKQLEKMV
jgi:hypothetical protein